MFAGVRHVHQWTHNAKMPDLIVIFTCGTEPFVAFMRIVFDHSAARTATLMKLARSLLLSMCFLLVVPEACLTPKMSVVQITRNSRPRRNTKM